MPHETKTFRVFVSSTFDDLKAERNALQEKVFPELQKLCEANGCRFQAVDLLGCGKPLKLNPFVCDNSRE